MSDPPLAPSVITGCIFDDPLYLCVPFVCSLAIEVGSTFESRTRPLLKIILDVALSVDVRQNVQSSSFRSQSTSCYQDAQRVSSYWCAQENSH